ncbi:MFS transporter [Chromohalobacter beijerinckii]|uniref:MFS transporter n=1 Tax=Chromohalobacter beijerinckii TaxID=86179 RepID=A0ABV8XHJ7_9GAMM|nr:MFS transporter [Chromohalobacter beijerinckii]MCK0764797.1 MFS transporter [Chromohalobacter beijerinckii]
MSTQTRTWHNWVAVAALGVGSFTIVTTELAPIGLLSVIGADLGTSTSQAGLIVTLYAWIAVAAALFTAVVLSRLPRRPLLVALMLILALSSALAAWADTFPALMGARVIGALSHGAFWAMIGTVGAQLVPPHRVGLATSIIFGGVSAASVLGVPLANLVGTNEGWRTAFAGVAALSFAVATVCFITLPKLPGHEGVGITALGRVLSGYRFIRIFAAIILTITAHFMAFTYIEPYLGAQSGIAPSAIAPLLFAFGGAGLAANVVTGGLIDRRLKTVLLISLCMASMALWVLSTVAGDLGLISTTLVLIVWGGAIAAILVGFQTWILKEAGADALPASAIYAAIFNGSIGLGAILGASISTLAGLSKLFLIAATAIAMGTLAIVLLAAPATTSDATE